MLVIARKEPLAKRIVRSGATAGEPAMVFPDSYDQTSVPGSGWAKDVNAPKLRSDVNAKVKLVFINLQF
jgi:hypothetical protein